jgi:hypothetical protein
LYRYEREGCGATGLDPYQFIKDLETSSQNIANKISNSSNNSNNSNNSSNSFSNSNSNGNSDTSIDTKEISKLLNQYGLITDLRDYQLQGILWMYSRLSISHSNNTSNDDVITYNSDAVNEDIYGTPLGWIPLTLKSLSNKDSSSSSSSSSTSSSFSSTRDYLYWYHAVTGEISIKRPTSMQLPNGGN